MIKRMTLLQRKEGLPTAAFREHWAGGHAQLALSMDGVVKYVQNRIDGYLSQVSPSNDAPYAPDGVVELYFSDAETMAKAQQGEVGRRLIPEDEPRFLRGWTLCIVSTEGPHDHEGFKVLAPAILATSVSLGDIKSELTAACQDGKTGLAAFAINDVQDSAKRPALWSEPKPPQVILALWFRSREAARAFCNDHRLLRFFEKISTCEIDPVVIL